ncbi:hypothetical protein PI124_g21570 [Phytophthora idaei]|nr:hypothetical protein PI125_g23321 [Phytophthora idaei]KAG3128534.1 hypothetical protein PI126_g21361 [Phytophthora idaei]KAG3233356.1 hypothetical protein PI124_g21570 [Phytophthora idaei]
MNTPGEKTFKQLWRELCKEGWKPREPFGMAKDHRYVKPGVKGRFDESKRGVDYFDGGCNAQPVATVNTPARPPIGKQASYATAGLSPLRSHASDSSPAAPYRAVPPVEVAVSRVVALGAKTRERAIPDATEQGSVEEGPIPDAAEQGGVEVSPIPDNSDSLPNPSEPGEEEATSESDEHIENGLVDLELFDSDDFMEGLRKENIFGPPDGDDVNIGVAGSVDDGESDADDEDVMADNASDSEHVEGVDDIDEDEKNEDDPDTELFGITSAALRDLSETGWIRYDETHSGKSG